MVPEFTMAGYAIAPRVDWGDGGTLVGKAAVEGDVIAPRALSVDDVPRSAIVSVGPPLSAREPRSRVAELRLPVPVKPHDASLERL